MMPKQQKRRFGRPPKEPFKRWKLVAIEDDGTVPSLAPGELIVVEVGSGLIRPDGTRRRSFAEPEETN